MLTSLQAPVAPFHSRPNARAQHASARRLLRAALALTFVVGAQLLTHAQLGGAGGEHVIYGDFKVDDRNAKASVPHSFNLLLITGMGNVVERQSVSPGSPFRFLGLRNGFYELVVEAAGDPVIRIRIQINSFRKMEYKQDIDLAWEGVGPAKSESKKGTVSAADFYERNGDNKSLFEKASGLIKKKKFEEAAVLLQKLVDADPKDYLAWTDLGTMRYALGDTAASEKAYTRALAEKPGLLAAGVNLGRVCVTTKNYEKAVEVLKATVEKHPTSADAHFLLGEAHLQTRNGDGAETHFNEALKLDPQGKADAHLRLAALYNAFNMKDKAAAELQRFIVKRPAHPERKQIEAYIAENRKK